MFSGLTTLLVLMHVMPLPWPHALACAVVKELAARAGGPVCRGPGAAVGAALPGAAASTLKPAIVLTKLICRTLMQVDLCALSLEALFVLLRLVFQPWGWAWWDLAFLALKSFTISAALTARSW